MSLSPGWTDWKMAAGCRNSTDLWRICVVLHRQLEIHQAHPWKYWSLEVWLRGCGGFSVVESDVVMGWWKNRFWKKLRYGLVFRRCYLGWSLIVKCNSYLYLVHISICILFQLSYTKIWLWNTLHPIIELTYLLSTSASVLCPSSFCICLTTYNNTSSLPISCSSC